MKGVDLLARDLEFAGPGRAYFVHLLIPHFPYAYDRDCEVLKMKEAWLDWTDPDLAPVKNDPESRAQRYLAYREQLLCTNSKIHEVLEDLSRRPWWDDALIVIHGDHGSRIDLVAPRVPVRDEFTDQGLMDSFSTFFAIKRPGVSRWIRPPSAPSRTAVQAVGPGWGRPRRPGLGVPSPRPDRR